MMKTKLFLALAAGLMVASCAQKEDLGVDTIAKADETRYLKVSLCNPSTATKAPDFSAGDADENAVETLYFMFYDKNGSPLGTPVVVDPKGLVWDTQTVGSNVNVEKFATSVVPVEVVKGQEVPAYVVCLLNAGNEISADQSYTMDQLRSTLRSSVQNPVNESKVETFPMINSVYYGADPFYGPDYRMFGTPIEISQLHSSQTAAEAAPAVDIYVERFAAKVSLTLPAADKIQAVSVDNGKYSLQFTPVAWGINADESATYVAKRFAASDAADAEAPAYSTINDLLGDWWNDAANHRSYWACSPSYYATSFPRVSDDIRDKYAEMTEKSVDTPNGSGALVGDYKLKYYSYNQLLANTIAAGDKKTLYVKENTASIDAFNSENPKAAVSSVVILGKYTVTSGAAALPENTTFYLYGGENKLYFTHNSGITGGKSILETMVANQAILATNKDGSLLKSTELAANHVAALEVNHPAKSVRKDQVVPARFVTLQIKKTEAGNYPFYYYDREADKPAWTQVDNNNIDKVNALLMQSVAFARAFYEGCCYFSIPIEHLGYGDRNGNGGKHYNEDGFDWTKVERGAFGIVRNHSYNINVTGISGLATGLHGKDNPIVPPMDSDEYFVAYRLNILSWAVVPTQDVNLN